jgi:hypothetical protein
MQLQLNKKIWRAGATAGNFSGFWPAVFTPGPAPRAVKKSETENEN